MQELRVNLTRLRIRPVFRDLLITLAGQAIVLASGLFVYRLAATYLGPNGIGEYALARRVNSFLQPLALLGLGVGLPRYIGIVGRRDRQEALHYEVSGGLVVLVLLIIVIAVINMFDEFFAKVLFGTPVYRRLIRSLSWLLLGFVLHSLCYAYYRGHIMMGWANFLQVLNIGILPLVAFLILPNPSTESVVAATGMAATAVSVVFLSPFIRAIPRHVRTLSLKTPLKELLRYGIPRAPADFGIAALLSLGPVFASHLVSMREVGYLAVSQAILTILQGVMAPLGLVLLPRLSKLFAQGKRALLREQMGYLTTAVLQISIFVSIQLIIVAEEVIGLWLGPSYGRAAWVMRCVLLASAPYVLYGALRSAIDAATVKAINTRNLYLSLGVFLASSGLVYIARHTIDPVLGLAAALAVSLIVLGIATLISIRALYGVQLEWTSLRWALLLTLVLAVPTLALKGLTGGAGHLVFLLLASPVALFLVYLAVLYRLETGWMVELRKGVLVQRIAHSL